MELLEKVGDKFKKIKDLTKFDEKTIPDIRNKIDTKIKDKTSQKTGFPIKINTDKNSDNISLNINNHHKNKMNINFDKNNETSKSIKSVLENETNSSLNNSKKSKKTEDSIFSRVDRSSEEELEKGILFYDEIEKGTKYKKYSYLDEFKKEIDGIYYKHSNINLGIGKKELNFNEYKTYEEFEKKYNNGDKNNDLKGYIIMKNFEETTIPEDVPFIIEIKAGFELLALLKQIKKAAKYVNNMKNYEKKPPKYFIGILCSFNKFNVMGAFEELDKFYDGSNSIDKDSNVKLLNHITKIIKDNKIKFVLAVIKDKKINRYYLGTEDYNVDKCYKKVELLYMYKAINNNDNLKQEDEEKIKNKIKIVCANYLKVYQTFNDEFTVKMTYNQVKELQEELEISKKNEENLIKEKREIQEEAKKTIEEMQKKYEEAQKKIEEMQKKFEEEGKKKIEEENKKMHEEEENRAKEDKNKNDQASGHHEKKNKKRKRI